MACTIYSPIPSAKVILFPPDRVFRPSRLVAAMKGADACERMILQGTDLQKKIGFSMLPENEQIIAEYTRRDGLDAA